MVHQWTNWSGSLQFTPERVECPADEAQLVDIISQARAADRKVRVVGAGHSSSPLVETGDVLLSLERFQGLIDFNRETCVATVGAGMTVHDAGKAFFDVDLAMHNTGDVDVQTLVGAIATGTHGSGKQLQNLSSMLIGVRMVTSAGKIESYSIDKHPEFLRAARVALGTLGIFTQVTVKLLPAFRLHRQEWCASTEDCLANLDELVSQNRNFDFYWYPRSDDVKLRTLNLPGEQPTIPYASLVEETREWSWKALPKRRQLKFDEMEYSLPAEVGAECFREIRERVKSRHRASVAWRVLYRTIAPDDSYLSPAYGRETVSISLHHNAGLPFQDYFNDIEPIFRAYGGRPHWGKKHNLQAEELQALYPMWQHFQQIRREMDPQGTLLTPYLHRLLESNG